MTAADLRGSYSIYSDEYKPSVKRSLFFAIKSGVGRSPFGRLLFPIRFVPRPDVALLNLGCGLSHFEGWCNAEFFSFRRGPGRPDWMLDFRYPLSCPSDYWEGIFSEHALEHLHPSDALTLLRELHRILKPGAFLRIVVPDLDIYLAYAAGRLEDPESRAYLESRWPTGAEAIWAVTSNFGHASTWNAELLIRLLHEAGFAEARRVAYDEGSDQRLIKDSAKRRPESLYVEARKSAQW
jgi:predicted SAM-dependent methyltransferase